MLQLFSIRDTKAEAFNRPFTSQNPAMAMREIQTAVNQSDNPMKTYAEDFALYLVGEFDEQTGNLTGMMEPHHICSILDLVNKDEIHGNA